MRISIHSGNEQISRNLKVQVSTGVSLQTGDAQKVMKQDKLSISQRANNLWSQNVGKKSATEQLMEQIQQITERRSQYMSNAMEKGVSTEVMKLELADFDAQIEEVETQIRKIKLEEQQKATGMDKENQKEENDEKEVLERGSIDSGQVEDPLASNTMGALVSASNKMNQISKVKMAQITLNSESKALENSDPARSKALKSKADGLNGKMMEITNDATSEISQAIKKDNKESLQQHQVENEGIDITEQEPSSKTIVQDGENPSHAQELTTSSEPSNGKDKTRVNSIDQRI
ncbi:hypothetical protein DCC85_22150 [Paenibacillus sp. CAA11]|uniref:hypothetical protein n=1 Tax=Paenibacillus sp. CAA11 TaxID=1532905 RepID=UPI000D3A12D6|nr:hypothetical protein [Paenibacillus sp. CAA11]AWB46605.1 hypothetical protein DCC85_22150 [Paenibacillus sp. CAA11]